MGSGSAMEAEFLQRMVSSNAFLILVRSAVRDCKVDV
jgi:hypothetical protein